VDREARRGVAFLSVDPKGAVRFLDAAPSKGDESFQRQFLRHLGLPDRGTAVLTRGDRQTIHRMLRAWLNAPPRSEDVRAIARALYAEAAALPDLPPAVAQRFRSLAAVPGDDLGVKSPVVVPTPEAPPEEDESEISLPAPPEDAPRDAVPPQPRPPPPPPTSSLEPREGVPPSPAAVSPPGPVEIQSPLRSPTPVYSPSGQETQEQHPTSERLEDPQPALPGPSAEEKWRLDTWMKEQHEEVERRRGMMRSQLEELRLREAEIAEREQKIRDEELRQQDRSTEIRRKAEEASRLDPARTLFLILFSMEGLSRDAAGAIAEAFVTDEKLRTVTVAQIAAVPGVKPEEAALVRDAFSEGAPPPRSIREKAEDLLEEERFDEALDAFDAIVREHPDDVAAWFNRSEVLALLGRTDEAIASLDRVLDIDPKHKATLRELANLLFEQGDFGLAAAHLNEFLMQEPDEAAHWLKRAADLLMEGKATEATLIYNAILEGDPTNIPASLALGDLLLAMDDVERADRVYSRVLQHHPDSPEALLKKGLLLNRQGRWGAAIQLFNRALSLRFDYHEAWAAKGQVLLTQGKAKEALEAFDKLISFDESLYGAWLGKAQAHTAAGEFDKATEAAGRAAALNKGNADARAIPRQAVPAEPPVGAPPPETLDKGVLMKMANSFLEGGDGEAALQGYAELLRVDPKDARAQFGKGRALHMLDRYAEALRCFTEAARVAPEVEEYERWRRTCEERVRKEGTP